MNIDPRDPPQIFEDKLETKSNEEREKISRLASRQRGQELEGTPIKGIYDIEHFVKIHKHLFKDVSTYAGAIRGYPLNKEVQFSDPSQFQYLFEKELPQRIEALKQSVNDQDKYIDGMTDLHSTLDISHPFREGNGRATRAFMAQLGKEHGYDMDFSKVDKTKWVEASVASIKFGNEELKRPIFAKVISLTPGRVIKPALKRSGILRPKPDKDHSR